MRGSRLRARFRQMQMRPLIEGRMTAAGRAEDVGGEAPVARPRLDQIEGPTDVPGRACARARPGLLGLCENRSSSSPNMEPTSTLVKKSPARPDRWGARA